MKKNSQVLARHSKLENGKRVSIIASFHNILETHSVHRFSTFEIIVRDEMKKY